MKILTLWQPWAGAVGIVKHWETRKRRTTYRGPLAIHAGLKVGPNKAFELWKAALDSVNGRGFEVPDAIFERGTIIATAKLVECQRTEDVAPELGLLEKAFGDYTPGRWAYKLEDVVPIKPVPWTGAQGMRDLPREVYTRFTIR